MILDIDKYCAETIINKKYLPEITSTSIKQSNGVYDSRGLFSQLYFGQENSSTWKTMFAKIVIPHPVIHPAIFYIINRRVSYLLKWINLDYGFIIDPNNKDNLILTNQVNKFDYCGLSDLYSNSKLVCESLYKTDNFKTLSAKTILQRIIDRKIPIFTSNVIVMPPAFRPPDQKISSDQDDINKFYIKILDEINILKSSMGSKDKILTNRILANIQSLYNNLFNCMIDKIKGKTGLVRGALLGKNADFSGRAVIVPDPLIKPSQLGIPRTMLIRLFYPWIINYIINHKEIVAQLQKLGVQVNINRLFELINKDLFEKNIDSNIVKILNGVMEIVIKDKCILAKRDPVLHKLSVRGFYPVPVDDSSIHITPLVCEGMNADFDGDQMAIFLPLTNKAQQIVKNEMLATKNLYAPLSGLSFSIKIDFILGIFYMSKDDMSKDIKPQIIPDSTSQNEFISMVFKADKFNIPVTYKNRTNTLGRRAIELLFNDYVKIEEKLTSKKISKLLEEVAKKHSDDLEEIMYRILKVSSVVSSFIGGTISVKDFTMDDELKKRRDEVIAHPDKYDVDTELKTITKDFLSKQNNYEQLPAMLVESGAKGSAGNIQQISVAKGYISDAMGRTLPEPIGSNFSDGFKPIDYFTSSYGNRKGVVDRALNTASSGYLQRQMVYLAAPVKSGDDINCHTNKFMEIPLIEEYLDVLKGRILDNGEILTKEYAERHNLIGKKIKIYSPMYCKSHELCRTCYPQYYRTIIDNASNVGVISGNVVGERGSQLIMKQFHCMSGSNYVYIKNNNEYGIYTFYKLFEDRKDKVIYTLNNTQEEIDTSNENLYVDNNGKWTKVLKIIRHRRNPDSPMICIKAKKSKLLVSQDNHKVSINSEYNFVEPKDIKIKEDKIIVSKTNIWQENIHECFMNSYLLGAYLGDGCIRFSYSNINNKINKPRSIQFAIPESNKDNSIRNKIIDIIIKENKKVSINKNDIRIFNSELSKKLHNMCGRYAWNKHFPTDFIYYKDEDLAKLMCGLIDTDGCVVSKDNNIQYIKFEMSSLAIINQLALICDKFNIKYNILLKNHNTKSNLNNKFKFKHQIYMLYIYPIKNNLNIFKESIKCSNLNAVTKRQNRYKNIDNNTIFFYNKILFIDNLKDSYVYDLTTEDHALSVNGIHVSNTGGAASVLYLSKEAPELQGIINQENNDLIAIKDIKIKVMDYESNSTDVYTSKDFIVTDIESKKDIEVHFKGDIDFNAMMAISVKNDEEDVELVYESGSNVGAISSQATDTTNAVKTVQKLLTHSNQAESPSDLVQELYEIFSGSATIPLIHFEILVSQLMRDPDKKYLPYRYGNMDKPPFFASIKSVSSLESPKRGVMFERILDTVTDSILYGSVDPDKRIKSDLEELFDI